MEAELLAANAPPAARRTWIVSPRWDLGWLIGSAIVVPLVLALTWAGASSALINLGVTALVGGPHLFSTFLATYLDPRFRRSHRGILAAITILVPAFVVTMTFWNFQALLSVFIFAASAHVIQQNGYLADLYRRRGSPSEPAGHRWIDYGLLAVCFYPIAGYKLVHDDFRLGGVTILLPGFLKHDATWQLTWAAFVVFGLLWIAKSVAEARAGRLNAPKTLLIGFTAAIAFLVPACASGPRLELAFQSVNMWHSIQYLGIVWIVLKLRRERGLLEGRFVRRLAGGPGACWLFYGTCFGLSVALLLVIAGLVRVDPFGLQAEQYYYMTILSGLLVHYALDGYLFAVSNLARVDPERVPFAAPASV